MQSHAVRLPQPKASANDAADVPPSAIPLALNRSPMVDGGHVMPSPQNPSKGPSRHLMRDWCRRAEGMAGLEAKPGRGWHSLRRKFASDLIDQPLKVLSELGGWKEPATILKCYQHPDQKQLADALKARHSTHGGPVQPPVEETPKLRLIR